MRAPPGRVVAEGVVRRSPVFLITRFVNLCQRPAAIAQLVECPVLTFRDLRERPSVEDLTQGRLHRVVRDDVADARRAQIAERRLTIERFGACVCRRQSEQRANTGVSW